MTLPPSRHEGRGPRLGNTGPQVSADGLQVFCSLGCKHCRAAEAVKGSVKQVGVLRSKAGYISRYSKWLHNIVATAVCRASAMDLGVQALSSSPDAPDHAQTSLRGLVYRPVVSRPAELRRATCSDCSCTAFESLLLDNSRCKHT